MEEIEEYYDEDDYEASPEEIREHQRNILNYVLTDEGFTEIKKTETENNDDFEVIKTTVTKGLFTIEEDKRIAVWHKDLKEENLPEILRINSGNSFKEIEDYYEGEKYLLILSEGKISAFDIKLFNMCVEIIDVISYHHDTQIKQRLISATENIVVFAVTTNWANFAISGYISSDNLDEEERIILSNKLEKSQPFFKFKAPLKIEWNKLKKDKDENFEKICELLLNKEPRIERVIPIGKTRASDRGRDFIIYEETSGFGNNQEEKWLVQCKFSEKSISPGVIAGWTDRILEHDCVGFWLMTNNDLTPSLYDQLKDVAKNEKRKIKVRFWQRNDFHIKLNVHSELLINFDFFEKE